jgi:hypothetical protein
MIYIKLVEILLTLNNNEYSDYYIVQASNKHLTSPSTGKTRPHLKQFFLNMSSSGTSSGLNSESEYSLLFKVNRISGLDNPCDTVSCLVLFMVCFTRQV